MRGNSGAAFGEQIRGKIQIVDDEKDTLDTLANSTANFDYAISEALIFNTKTIPVAMTTKNRNQVNR